VILLDYVPTTPMDAGNLPWHLIFGMDGGQVSTTIVGGKVLMRDRQLLTLDEEAVCARSRELAQKLWARM
jgi:cytosine/adenosine deaminase-related metal-dependent hydrolase